MTTGTITLWLKAYRHGGRNYSTFFIYSKEVIDKVKPGIAEVEIEDSSGNKLFSGEVRIYNVRGGYTFNVPVALEEKEYKVTMKLLQELPPSPIRSSSRSRSLGIPDRKVATGLLLSRIVKIDYREGTALCSICGRAFETIQGAFKHLRKVHSRLGKFLELTPIGMVTASLYIALLKTLKDEEKVRQIFSKILKFLPRTEAEAVQNAISDIKVDSIHIDHEDLGYLVSTFIALLPRKKEVVDAFETIVKKVSDILLELEVKR